MTSPTRPLSAALFALLLPVAACGGVDALIPGDSAPTIDGGPDAQPVTGSARVHVPSAASPASSVMLVIDHADGTFVETVGTDASGDATATITAGDSITLVQPGVGTPRLVQPDGGTPVASGQLITVMGVQPGDELTLGQPELAATSFNLAVTVTIPLVPGATNYLVVTPCGTASGSELPVVMTLRNDCGASTDFYVIATTPTATSSLYAKDQAIASGSVMLGGPFAPAHNVTLNVTNVSPAFEVVNAGLISVDGANLLDNVNLQLTRTGTTATGSAQLTFGAGADLVAILFGGRHGFGTQIMITRVASDTAGIDFGNTSIGEIAGQPVFDVKTGRLVWTEVGAGTADTMAAELLFNRTGTSPLDVRWAILAPYHRGSLTLPTLPTQFAQFAPQAADQPNGANLILIKRDGYDAAVRGTPFASAGGLLRGQELMPSAVGRSTVVSLTGLLL